MQIERLDEQGLTVLLPQLVALLQDTVANGGTVGFIPPITEDDASAYWRDVLAALRTPYRVLLVARAAGQVIGTVQLDMARQHNGQHRAEIMKLMVAESHRRQGIGHALMHAIEAEARQAGRSTLVLDTREGDAGERLYLALGYIKAGTIPRYARNTDGSFHSTVILYKLLRDVDA